MSNYPSPIRHLDMTQNMMQMTLKIKKNQDFQRDTRARADINMNMTCMFCFVDGIQQRRMCFRSPVLRTKDMV